MCTGPQLCSRQGAVIHGEQSSINTEEEKLHRKQCFLCFSLQWSSVGRPAAADEMKIDFPTGSAIYLIPTYCTEEEDEEEVKKEMRTSEAKTLPYFCFITQLVIKLLPNLIVGLRHGNQIKNGTCEGRMRGSVTK